MSEREAQFWERVHAALDERRDPLEDPHVQALVAQEPRRLAELERLRAGLAQLALHPPRIVEPRRRSWLVPAAAAALVLGALGVNAWRRAPAHEDDCSRADTDGDAALVAARERWQAEVLRALEAPDGPRVLHARVERAVSDARGTHLTVFDDGEVSTSFVASEHPSTAAPVGVAAYTISISNLVGVR